MGLGSKRMRAGVVATVVATAAAWAAAVVLVNGQAAPAAPEGELLAEQVFKNVQVLKGIPVSEFMGTMGVFSAALGMSCEDCHASGGASWEAYAKDNPRKQMARVMVTMMATINKTHFRGRQMVTCVTCHRGSDRPKQTASLEQLYGFPPPEDPPDVITQAPGAVMADEVLDKYIQAVGGAARLKALTSWVATGSVVGYGPDSETRQVQIFARAPGQKTTVIQTTSGNYVTVTDGTSSWYSAPFRPVPVLTLTGQELQGARFEAAIAFPGNIKTSLSDWRVGRPATVDDKETTVVQGTGPDNTLVSLYFEDATGLLLRLVRYADSPVGKLVFQTDYTEYRDVAGVKLPHQWTSTWLDGRETFEIKQIQPNVTIEAGRFAKPAPPPAVVRR